MSFDLGIWDKQIGTTADVYLKLCEGEFTPEGTSQALLDFYLELTRRWPEMDSIPEERIGDFDYCPWSTGPLERSGMHIIINCVWPKAQDVGEYVSALAYKHGLVLYDPQEDAIKLPRTYRKRSWWPF